VVFCGVTREDVHHAMDLLVAVDDRVQLPGLIDEVVVVRLKRLLEVGIPRHGLHTGALLYAEVHELGAHPCHRHDNILEAVGDLRVLEQTEQQLVDGVVQVRALFLCVDCARRRTSTSVVDTRTDFDGEVQWKLLWRIAQRALEQVPSRSIVPRRPRDGLS
jgi:hypothetical protein